MAPTRNDVLELLHTWQRGGFSKWPKVVMSLLQIGKAKQLFKIYLSTHPKLTLKSMKNGKSHEWHLDLCANFEKDVKIFSAEGRAASIVTSYIENKMPLNEMLTETVLNAVFPYRLTGSG